MSLTGWILYTLMVGLLATTAALSLEQGLTRVRIPSRWIWVLALVVSVALPLAALRPDPPSVAEPVGVGIAERAAEVGSSGVTDGGRELFRMARALVAVPAALGGVAVDALGSGLDRVVAALPSGPEVTRWTVALWVWWSVALAGALGISALVMARQRRRWPHSSVRGRAVRIAPDFGPAVVGVLRPEIVLPGWMPAGLRDEDIEMVLTHEEEHLRARDPLLLGASLVPLLALPWNPAIWWQIRKLREAVEVDCDRRVLRKGASAGAYGSLLVRIGNRRRSPSLLPAPALASSHPLLLRRLEAMRRPGRGSLVVTGLTGLLSFGLFGLALEAHTPTVPALVVEPTAEPAIASQVASASGAESLAAAGTATAPTETPTAPLPMSTAPLGAATPAAEVAAIVTEVDPPVPPPAEIASAEPSGADVVSGESREPVVGEGGPGASEAPVTPPAVVESEPRDPILVAFGVVPPVLPPAADPVRVEPQVALPTTRTVVNPSPAVPPSTPDIREIPPRLRNIEGIERALRREYPSGLRTAGIGGTVHINLLVNDRGAVSEASLAQSSGYPAFDAAALRVVQTVQFTPASHAGRTVAIWTQLPITFQPTSE